MKRQLLLVMMLMFGVCTMSYAVENVTVPSMESMTSINGSYNNSEDDGSFVLNSGALGTMGGKNNVIVVRRDASATVTGEDCVVYVFDGGSATVTGKNNTIYHEEGATVSISDQDSNKDVAVSSFTS